jgi:transcriptional regulator with XRE-family HTH domain
VSLKSTVDFVIRLLTNKKSRDAYVYEHIRNGISFQLRALREQREWSQDDLAKATKKSRTTITRLENPNNDQLTLNTLLELASAFDVALLIKFVPFSRLLKEYEDVSSQALSAQSIGKEKRRLLAWAAAKDRAETASNTGEMGAAVSLKLVEPAAQPELFGDKTETHWKPVAPLKVAAPMPGRIPAPNYTEVLRDKTA